MDQAKAPRPEFVDLGIIASSNEEGKQRSCQRYHGMTSKTSQAGSECHMICRIYRRLAGGGVGILKQTPEPSPTHAKSYYPCANVLYACLTWCTSCPAYPANISRRLPFLQQVVKSRLDCIIVALKQQTAGRHRCSQTEQPSFQPAPLSAVIDHPLQAGQSCGPKLPPLLLFIAGGHVG